MVVWKGIKKYHNTGNIWTNLSRHEFQLQLQDYEEVLTKTILLLSKDFVIYQGQNREVFSTSNNALAHTCNLIVGFDNIKANQIIQQKFLQLVYGPGYLILVFLSVHQI